MAQEHSRFLAGRVIDSKGRLTAVDLKLDQRTVLVGTVEDKVLVFDTKGRVRYVKQSDIASGGLIDGSDGDAYHQSVVNEIKATTAKAVPVAADVFLIEDSVVAGGPWAKKSVTLASLMANLPCPVVINEAGAACIPVLRMEGTSQQGMIYATHVGGDATLGLMMESAQSGLEEPIQGFLVTLGGNNDQTARSRGGLVIQGRAGEAFAVTGAYGGGGDDLFVVSTSSGRIDVNVGGDMSVRDILKQGLTTVVLSADANPWAGPGRSIVRFTSAAAYTVQTISVPTTEINNVTPIYRLINANAAGGFSITIEESDISGTGVAAERIITGSGDVALAPNDTADLWYDPVDNRWRVMT